MSPRDGESARQGAPAALDQLARHRGYRARPTLLLRLEPEELVKAWLEVFSPADEARLAHDLRTRRDQILRDIEDALDDALTRLEQRSARWRWTANEVEGRQAA